MATIDKRKWEDGSTTYRVRVRIKGHPQQVASFERLTDAKRWAAQTETAIRQGRHFQTVEAKKHTLGELIDRYIEDIIPKKGRTGANQVLALERWKQALGPYLLSDITPAMIDSARSALLKETTIRGKQRSGSTVNRYLAALSHCFTVAVKQWGWLEDNPMRKVIKEKEPRGRVRFLSDDERERLLAACRDSNPALYPVVATALYTGARQEEIMGLKWEDVDLVVGRLIFHKTKNDERRQVPLAGPAREALQQWSKIRRLDTPLLFPSTVDPLQPIDLRTPWETVVKHTELEDFHFHDLRHTAASYLAMSGATLAEIAEILGHKTLSMVKRYAHLTRTVWKMEISCLG